MDRRMDGWMDGWMDGQMGWIDGLVVTRPGERGGRYAAAEAVAMARESERVGVGLGNEKNIQRPRK